MFPASSAHLQEDIVVYKQHMVPSLSIRVLVACRYAAGVRTDWRGKVVGGCLKTTTNNLASTVSSHSSCVPTGHHELSWRLTVPILSQLYMKYGKGKGKAIPLRPEETLRVPGG